VTTQAKGAFGYQPFRGNLCVVENELIVEPVRKSIDGKNGGRYIYTIL
jgi:hypothetical protein